MPNTFESAAWVKAHTLEERAVMDITKHGAIAASLASGTALLSLIQLLVDRNVISNADAVAILDRARVEIEGLSPSDAGSNAAKLVVEMITRFKPS